MTNALRSGGKVNRLKSLWREGRTALGAIATIPSVQTVQIIPVILGGVATTPEQARQMIARGYRALVVGFDWSLLQRGIAAAIEGIGSY